MTTLREVRVEKERWVISVIVQQYPILRGSGEPFQCVVAIRAFELEIPRDAPKTTCDTFFCARINEVMMGESKKYQIGFKSN